MEKINYQSYAFLKINTIAFLLFISFTVFSQNYPNIVNYNFNGTPAHGVKIKTNLPFEHGHHMPTVKIEGYSFERAEPINLSLVWYVYDNNFCFEGISSFGASTPDVWLSNEGGKVVVFIDERVYYQRFTVSAFAQGMSEEANCFQNWTVVDEPLSGTQQKK